MDRKRKLSVGMLVALTEALHCFTVPAVTTANVISYGSKIENGLTLFLLPSYARCAGNCKPLRRALLL